MADTIAQLAIKTVLDGTEVTQGFQRQQKEAADFARDVQSATTQKGIAPPPNLLAQRDRDAAEFAKHLREEEAAAVRQQQAEEAAARRQAAEQRTALARQAAEVERRQQQEVAAEARRLEQQRNEILQARRRILEEIKTPQERERERLAEINRLLQVGALTQDQANRARKQVVPDPVSLRDRGQGALDALKKGDLAGAGKEAAAAFGQVVQTIANIDPRIKIAVAGATAFAAVLSSVAVWARQASHDVEGMTRFGERLGTSAQSADALRRSLEMSGVEDPSRTLTRFNQHVGDAIASPQGATADTFRRLGIDPSTLGNLDQDFARTVAALNGLGSAYQRTAESQNLFGREGLQLQELLRRGQAGIDRAAGIAELAAPSPETARAAREAEGAWRRVGDSIAGVRAELKQFQDAAGSQTSQFIAQTIESALERLGVTRQGVRERRVEGLGPPRSQGDVLAERQLNQLRQERELRDNLFETAQNRGLVGANATRQEVASVADLLQAEQALRREMEANNGTPAEIDAAIGRRRSDNVLIAQQREHERSQEVFENLAQELRSVTTLRGEAERLGLVRTNATRQEVDAVKPLIEARERLSRLNFQGAGVLVRAFDAGANVLTTARAADAAAELANSWREAAQSAGLTAQQARQLAIAQAEARQQAAGWLGFLLRGAVEALRAADATLTQREQLQQMGQQAEQLVTANQRPTELLRGQLEALRFNTEISAETATRETARAFRQAVSALGNGPSSFGLSGTDSRSREGLLKADDFRIRGEVEDANLPRQQLETLRRMEEFQQDQDDRIGRAVARELARAGGFLRRAPG